MPAARAATSRAATAAAAQGRTGVSEGALEDTGGGTLPAEVDAAAGPVRRETPRARPARRTVIGHTAPVARLAATHRIRAVLATASWGQAAVSVVLLGAYVTPYALRARTLARRGRPVPPARIACFAAGVTLLIAAVAPPVIGAADERLTAHMLEHLAIGDVAPLLVVLGLTGPMLAPLLRAPALRRARGLTHPVIAVGLWALNLYLWHLRPAYEAAVAHDLVHVLQHACFFAFGLNLWLALLGPLPKPEWFGNGARLAYVLVVTLGASMLAYGFVWSDVAFYPHYAATAARAGRSAIADQSAAGAIMLLEESVVMVGLFGWLLARTLRDAGRRQELAELAAAHGVPVDERRIARAVAADRGEALARRIREIPGT
jgi:putative membrane protein